MKYGEDTLFWYYVYLASTGKGRIIINTPVYFYRKHENSAMGKTDAASYSIHTCDLIKMGKTYQQVLKENPAMTSEKADNTRKRIQLSILGALTILPKSDLDYSKTMSKLRQDGLYPLPIMWWHIIDTVGWKNRIIEAIKLGFSWELFYKIYYTIRKAE